MKTGWASPFTADGDVYAEPLVVGNTVVIATENNSVYGLNAATGAQLWQTNLGTPVPNAQLPCGNIDPVGITGTPVIDMTAGMVYAVGLIQGTPIHYDLAAIHLSDGTRAWQRRITVTGFDETIEGQRGALTLLNGTLYIPFGGRAGDCGNYHGYLFATPPTSTGGVTFFQASTDNGAGFWQPAGASVAAGNLYVTSGNSYDTGTYDGGETVFKLSPSLAQLSYFAPSNWQPLNQTDTDLGSTGPLPVGNKIFQVGKAGEGYFLSQANLGGIGGQTFRATVCSQTTDAAFGGDAYVAPYIIVPCTTGPVALRVTNSSCATFAIAWTGPATSYAAPPIVAGGLVWIMDPSGTIYALDPITGSTSFSQSIGGGVHFATPAAGDGAVFVAASTQVFSFVSNGPPGPPPGPLPNPPSQGGNGQWWCQTIVNVPTSRIPTPWWRRH